MIHIRTWLKYRRQTFWLSFIKKIEAKEWPVEGERFKEIRPGDLVFNPTWPIFKLDQYIIKWNILVECYEDWSKTVASRVHTRF